MRTVGLRLLYSAGIAVVAVSLPVLGTVHSFVSAFPGGVKWG